MKANRKKRKLAWIRAKNQMSKYPDCSYNGDFYCNHVYEPDYPWVWVDFRFFHSKLKKYFAVSMITIEYAAWCKAEDDAYDICNLPNPWEKYNSKDQRMSAITAALKLKNELMVEFSNKEQIIQEKVELKNYRSGIIGVHAVLNTAYIDEHYIRDFIKFFRELGEPIKPGIVWVGKEVPVVAARLNQRFKNA